jgi:hypothetical protein
MEILVYNNPAMGYLLYHPSPEYPYIENCSGDPPKDLVRLWGVRSDGRIIYAPPKTPPPAVGSAYSPYNESLNHRRRVEFESKLAELVLNNANLVRSAIKKVDQAISEFLHASASKDPTIWEFCDRAISGFMFSPRHFGVMGSAAPTKEGEALQRLWDEVINGACNIPTEILFHQCFNQSILPQLLAFAGESCNKEFTHWSVQLRPDEYFKERGRRQRTGVSDKRLTTVIGITDPADDPVAFGEQAHSRAVDTVEPDLDNVSDFFLSSFLWTNMPFIAGPSGSAGSALTCAKTMAKLSGEDLQQYALACVAHFVGGGMHSFHEVMAIASLAGAQYTPDNYAGALPRTLAECPAWKKLSADYAELLYDCYLV